MISNIRYSACTYPDSRSLDSLCMPHALLLLFALCPALALPAINPLSITPQAIPASGNVSIFIAVPRTDVDPMQFLFIADDSYAVTLLFLPGTVLPVPPRSRLQITVACTVKNLTHIFFTPPAFSNSEVVFQVTTISTKGKVPVALLRSPNVPCVLRVFSNIVRRMGGSCSAAGPCIMVFQGYGFNTDVNQYRCVLAEVGSSSSSWIHTSGYSTVRSLGAGLQEVVCSIGALAGHGEDTLSLGLQLVHRLLAPRLFVSLIRLKTCTSTQIDLSQPTPPCPPPSTCTTHSSSNHFCTSKQ